MRVFSTNLPGDIRREVDRAARGADTDIDRAGVRMGGRLDEAFNRRIGGSFERAVRRDINRARPNASRLFGSFGRGLGTELTDEFRTGIGAGRPGPAIVSMLALAGPSAIGAAAAVGTAAAGALTAAMASGLLTGGLLFAAFKSKAESLKAGTQIWSAVGKALGTTIADGMAEGFTTAAHKIQDTAVPALTGPLQRAGQALGGLWDQLATTLTRGDVLDKLGRILDNNSVFIGRLGTSLAGLSAAFITLWDASKPMIDLVGTRLADFGTWADEALNAAAANGSLAKVMDNLTQLASTVFDWFAKLGPAFGNWLLNLDPARITESFRLFGQILGDVGDIVGQIADGAGPHFHLIMENIHTVLSNIVSSGVIETVASHVGHMLDVFTNFVAVLSQNPIAAQILALGVAFGLFSGFLSPVFSLLGALQGALGALSGALGTLLLPVLAVVGVFIALWTQSEKFRTAIGDLVSTVSGKFTEIWDKISPKLEPLWNNFLRLAQVIGDRLAPVIEFIAPIIGRFLDLVGTALDFIITNVGEFLGLLADLLSGDFEGAWEHAKNIVLNFWNFITTIFEQIRLFIGQVWTSILDFLRGIWDSIWAKAEQWLTDTDNAIHTVWNGIVDFFVMIWNSIVQFFTDRWNEIIAGAQEAGAGFVAWWNNLWAWTGEQLAAAWNGIVAFLSGIWNWLTSTIMSVGDAIQSAWNAALQWVSDTTVNIWNAILGFLSGIWNAITGGITAAGNAIQSAWNAALNWISDTTSSIWNGIWGFLSGVWDTITGAIRSTGNAIQSAWNSALNAISDIAHSVWDGITGFLSGVWSGIQGAASSAWDGIKNAIVQPIIDAYNTVVGWINNIKEAVGGAISWISGKVDEANNKLDNIISAQAQAGTVTANIFNPDAIAPPPAQLARGGIIAATPGGINAVVGEGRNNERIEPLDSQGLSRRDRALITQIVNTMVTGGSGGGGPITVQVRIGDRELTDVMSQVIGASNDALARRIAQRKRR